MSTRRIPIAVSLLAMAIGQGVTAQDAGKPLSVIDWLSDSVATPVAMPGPGGPRGGEPVASSALPETVTVMPLGLPSPDAVGLLAPAQTGLPKDLWGASSSQEIATRLRKLEGADMLPAARDLLRTLLLAELDPPADTGADTPLFLARIDALLAQGALTEAEALIDRAGTPRADVFRRWFDVSLLLGSENSACARLRITPDLSPTFPARIFCLARSGDWDAAALTLETAEALGMLNGNEDDLLARFLHVELADEDTTLLPVASVTPLTFRIYEAIGEPLPTSSLPLAFAQADLRDNVGWKARLEAGERLARVGSIPPETLDALYTERLPAASGQPWDRVEAYQHFVTALERANPTAVAKALPEVWQQMEAAELEVVFARLHGEALARLPLNGKAAALATRIGLLSPGYEAIAQGAQTDPLLVAIALGEAPATVPKDAFARAVVEGFTATAIPDQLRPMVQGDRLGEAILEALDLLITGAQGNLDELVDALAFLRNTGLEDTSRRLALQLLLLERRG